MSSPEPSETPTKQPAQLAGYWRANIRIVLCLLAIWFAASFGLGILGVVPLNRFKMGGFPLGFWFAQQGSIFVFMGLVIAYALIMERLDRKYDVNERKEPRGLPIATETTPPKTADHASVSQD